MIYERMQGLGKYDTFAQGKEIVDHAQGLTLFLCQKGTNGPLKVTMYREVTDEVYNVTVYDRVACPLNGTYESAKGASRFRIFRGKYCVI